MWLPKKTGGNLPPVLAGWLNDNLGPQYATPDVKSADVGYIYGKPGDTYRFAYCWIYPK